MRRSWADKAENQQRCYDRLTSKPLPVASIGTAGSTNTIGTLASMTPSKQKGRSFEDGPRALLLTAKDIMMRSMATRASVPRVSLHPQGGGTHQQHQLQRRHQEQRVQAWYRRRQAHCDRAAQQAVAAAHAAAKTAVAAAAVAAAGTGRFQTLMSLLRQPQNAAPWQQPRRLPPPRRHKAPKQLQTHIQSAALWPAPRHRRQMQHMPLPQQPLQQRALHMRTPRRRPNACISRHRRMHTAA